MKWPHKYKDEIIKISQFPDGSHWYLSSSENRLFTPEKYPNYDAAFKMAENYVSKDKIKIGKFEKPIVMKDGD